LRDPSYQSLSLLERAVSELAEVLGADHCWAAGASRYLGVLCRKLGELALAEQHLTRALEVELAIGNISGIIWTKYALASLFVDKGELVKADQMIREAMAISEEQFGPAHPTMSNLADKLRLVILKRMEAAGQA